MSEEQILRKIELLKEDLIMQIEGSVMHDTIMLEIQFLKKELEKTKK
jgi:hypothetical protein